MDYEAILYSVTEGVARITFNRPLLRNAQNRQLLLELNDAMGAAEADMAVRVVVLAAAGEHFSAGHDLKEVQQQRSVMTVEERWDWEEEFYLDHCLRIWDLKKPTIASVQGACVAAGFMVANMCDLIVAADDAFFADPVAFSLGAAAVEVLVHPWALGARKAKELLFTGGRVTAAEAYNLGMVNQLVPRAKLAEATARLAERIALAPPFGLRLIKRSINRMLDIQGFRNSIMAHFDTHELSHESATFKTNYDAGIAGAIKAGKKAAAE